jgi:hypothetical protein
MTLIAHLYFNSRRSLLGTAIQAIPKHDNPHADQDRRKEKLGDPVPREPIEIVKKQEYASADEHDGADGPIPGDVIQRVGQSLTGAPRLRGTGSIDGHVKIKDAKANPKSGFSTAAHRAVHANDEKHQEDCEMNHAFTVLLVIKGAEAW